MSKKVWVYCRMAREDVPALERQKNLLKEFAKGKGFEVVGITSEFGSGLNPDRKGLKEIEEVAKNKRAEMILTKDVSKISRNLTDYFQITEEIEKHIQFRAIDNFDTETKEEFKTMTKAMYEHFKDEFKKKNKKVDQTVSANLI